MIVRVDREVAKEISQGIFHDIIRVVALLLEDVKLVAVSDYDKGVVTEKLISVVSEICRSRNIPVFVNPSGTEYGKYREADLLVPNFRSLEILYGKEICDFDEMQKAAGLIFSASACKACIITWGCNGAVLFRMIKNGSIIPVEMRSARLLSQVQEMFFWPHWQWQQSRARLWKYHAWLPMRPYLPLKEGLAPWRRMQQHGKK